MAILAMNITGRMPVPRRLAMPQPTACHGHPGHQHHGHDARATSPSDAATNRVPWPSWPSTSRARCPCHVASRCRNQPRAMAILAINITGTMPVPRRLAMPQPTACHGHPGHQHHGHDARATSRRDAPTNRVPWPSWPSTSRARCPYHVASRCRNQPRGMAILAMNITGRMPVPRRVAMPQPTASHGHPGHEHHGQDARATSRRDAPTNRVAWPSWPSTSRAGCPCHVASRCPNQPRGMAILAMNITGKMPVPRRAGASGAGPGRTPFGPTNT
jgi:hypothetical protein